MAHAIQCDVASCLSPDFDSSTIRKVPVDLNPVGAGDFLAFLLENVFTAEECQNLIEVSESEGYSPAMVHSSDGSAHLAPGYRDGFRIMIDDKQFVKILFSRISSFLPQKFQKKKLVEINERLRFLKYYEGDEFKPHYDSHYSRDDYSARTLITLQMYLNEGFEGGETTFLKFTQDDQTIRVPVVPKTGMILVFEHEINHEGSLVKSGEKYTIRTDVLYTTQIVH